MRKKRFSGLFFNAVLALSLISLVPLSLIGVYLTRVNSRLLQHEIYQRQQTVAGGLSTVINTYMAHTVEFFTVFLDLHTDFGGHAFLNQYDLDYLRAKNPAVTQLALLNPEGQTLLQAGTAQDAADYTSLLAQILQACIEQQKNYQGPVVLTEQGWLALMAFPVQENLADKQSAGVLTARSVVSFLRESKIFPQLSQ